MCMCVCVCGGVCVSVRASELRWTNFGHSSCLSVSCQSVWDSNQGGTICVLLCADESSAHCFVQGLNTGHVSTVV